MNSSSRDSGNKLIVRVEFAADPPREPPVRSSKGDRPYLPFDMVVIDGHGWILNVAHECRPAFEAIVASTRDGRTVGHTPPLFVKPEMQRIQDWPGPLLSRLQLQDRLGLRADQRPARSIPTTTGTTSWTKAVNQTSVAGVEVHTPSSCASAAALRALARWSRYATTVRFIRTAALYQRRMLIASLDRRESWPRCQPLSHPCPTIPPPSPSKSLEID